MKFGAEMTATTLPHVVLRERRALPLFSRHPWVFSGAVARIDEGVQTGDEVSLVTHGGEFIARGLYNADSNIQVRLYSWQEDVPLDEAFWSARLDEAIALRRDLFGEWAGDKACRLVFSEGDGLSGLIVDRYGDYLLVMLTSAALAKRQQMLVQLLTEKLHPAGIWLRTEKGLRDTEGLEIADGLVSGSEPPRPLVIREHGVVFEVDVVQGQKTGFYLDQRDNRRAASQFASGARVLDVCCYTGGFGLTAAKLGGAREVLGLDVSENALNAARANAQLNGVADRCRYEKAKAFDGMQALTDRGEQFDLVVLDPPKMARHRSGASKALRGYFSMNRMAVDLVRSGGYLVTCSCSGLVDRADFLEMLAQVGHHANRRIQVLEMRGAAPDHPVSAHCPENDYLKCLVCRVV